MILLPDMKNASLAYVREAFSIEKGSKLQINRLGHPSAEIARCYMERLYSAGT